MSRRLSSRPFHCVCVLISYTRHINPPHLAHSGQTNPSPCFTFHNSGTEAISRSTQKVLRTIKVCQFAHRETTRWLICSHSSYEESYSKTDPPENMLLHSVPSLIDLSSPEGVATSFSTGLDAQPIRNGSTLKSRRTQEDAGKVEAGGNSSTSAPAEASQQKRYDADVLTKIGMHLYYQCIGTTLIPDVHFSCIFWDWATSMFRYSFWVRGDRSVSSDCINCLICTSFRSDLLSITRSSPRFFSYYHESGSRGRSRLWCNLCC